MRNGGSANVKALKNVGNFSPDECRQLDKSERQIPVRSQTQVQSRLDGRRSLPRTDAVITNTPHDLAGIPKIMTQRPTRSDAPAPGRRLLHPRWQLRCRGGGTAREVGRKEVDWPAPGRRTSSRCDRSSLGGNNSSQTRSAETPGEPRRRTATTAGRSHAGPDANTASEVRPLPPAPAFGDIVQRHEEGTVEDLALGAILQVGHMSECRSTARKRPTCVRTDANPLADRAAGTHRSTSAEGRRPGSG